MKLNKYTLILAGGLSLFMMTSCNDFLDREPLDAITPETFLWNDADMSAYMIKQYSFSTHSGAGVGIWEMIMELITNVRQRIVLLGYQACGEFQIIMTRIQAIHGTSVLYTI